MQISFLTTLSMYKDNIANLTVIALDCNTKTLPLIPGNLLDVAQKALKYNNKPLKTGVEIVFTCSDIGLVVLIGICESTRQARLELASAAITKAQKEHIEQVQLIPPINSNVDALVDLAYGARLANYRYDKYRNKKTDNQGNEVTQLNIFTPDAKLIESAIKAEKKSAALASGVYFTRDLVSAPPNILYPDSFATQLEALSKIGLRINILDVTAMQKLGMGALLGVGQGSYHPPRLVSIHWDNNPKQDRPLAIVGKGVTFDTGGISLKPSKNMDEMKSDMAGAGVVAGIMKAIALQEAKINVVGVVALAENMPGSNAQRPGDIVTAMDGQTIAVHNTDAEGRLILADALIYTRQQFNPSCIVDLATLTGAIVVALGSEYAGLFSNNDNLAKTLITAGLICGEKVWRLPLHKNYNAQLNTLEADMCNIGGRSENGASAIIAAQFLQRFVGETAWAHLDIAGVAWKNIKSQYISSGASGFGVTLLHEWLLHHQI